MAKKNIQKSFQLKTLLKYFTAFLFFAIAVIYITYPLIFHLGDYVTNYGDEYVIAWIQNWVIHAVTTNPLALWNTNSYYPYQTTWAYSDLLITSSLLAIIPLKIIGQPIATFNFTVISSLIFLGFSLFLLSYYLTKNFLVSLLSGIVVVFSPAVLDKTVHIQILALEWVPLSLLSFFHFIKTTKTKFLSLSMFFFLMQTYNSLIPGYFLVFFYLVTTIYLWLTEKQKIKILITKKNIFVLVFTFLALIPIALPYYKVSHEFHYVRPFRETIHFALQPEDYIYSNSYSKLQPYLQSFSDAQHYQQISGEVKTGYMGITLTLGFIILLVLFLLKKKDNNPYFSIIMFTGILGFILSFGPFLHIQRMTIHHPFPIPLPYIIFYYLFPGFQAFRDSERWQMLLILCIPIAMSIYLSNYLHAKNKIKQIGVPLFLILIIIFEFNPPMHFQPVPQVNTFPKMYSWLQEQPQNTSYIMLPIYNWNMKGAAEEIERQYYSTIEFRPMVNGYSGFSPPPWQELIQEINSTFPNEKIITQIKNIPVKYIIVDKNKYDEDYKNKEHKVNGESIIKSLMGYKNIKFIRRIENNYIFEVTN